MTSLKFMKMFLLLILPFTLILTSCSKEMEDDEYMDAEFNIGDGQHAINTELDFDPDCFEFVYPIEVLFPEASSTITFEDEASLDQAIDEWEEQGGDSLGLPMPIFPISVILDDGTTSEFGSNEEFIALLESCPEEEEEEEGNEDEHDDDDKGEDDEESDNDDENEDEGEDDEEGDNDDEDEDDEEDDDNDDEDEDDENDNEDDED